MIDAPDRAARLLDRLRAALPMPARVTPEAAAALLDKHYANTTRSLCSVTAVSYAGDEGGIVCRLEFGDDAGHVVFASITHLRFDPRLPLAREIAIYQKHRVKRLRHQSP